VFLFDDLLLSRCVDIYGADVDNFLVL